MSNVSYLKIICFFLTFCLSMLVPFVVVTNLVIFIHPPSFFFVMWGTVLLLIGTFGNEAVDFFKNAPKALIYKNISKYNINKNIAKTGGEYALILGVLGALLGFVKILTIDSCFEMGLPLFLSSLCLLYGFIIKLMFSFILGVCSVGEE